MAQKIAEYSKQGKSHNKLWASRAKAYTVTDLFIIAMYCYRNTCIPKFVFNMIIICCYIK